MSTQTTETDSDVEFLDEIHACCGRSHFDSYYNNQLAYVQSHPNEFPEYMGKRLI